MLLTRTYRILPPALGLALYALPAWAADAEAEREGLPQFDTSLFPEQLFWLAITFSFLYVLMKCVALPRVKKTQDNRQGIIAGELAAAESANQTAKAMIAQYEKALVDARTNAQATVSEIAAAAAKEAATQQAAQQQDLNKRLHEAEAKIKASRDAAIADMKNGAADLASAIVEKVVGAKVKA